MLYFVLLSLKDSNKPSVNWLLFDTEKSISQVCSLCSRINRNLLIDPTAEFSPKNNSFCHRNENNIYCSFIKNMSELIKFTYRERSIPRAACSEIGPCLHQSQVKETGEYCFECKYMTSLLKLYNIQKNRVKFVKKFCRSARNVFGNFCRSLGENDAYFLFIDDLVQNIDDACNKAFVCVDEEYDYYYNDYKDDEL